MSESTVAAEVERYRSTREQVERGVLPRATSVDGSGFELQASLHGLRLRRGGYVVLETPTGPRLGQVTDLVVSTQVVDRPGAGGSGPGASLRIALAQGDGVVLDGDVQPFHDAAVRPATSQEVAAGIPSPPASRAGLTVGELAAGSRRAGGPRQRRARPAHLHVRPVGVGQDLLPRRGPGAAPGTPAAGGRHRPQLRLRRSGTSWTASAGSTVRRGGRGRSSCSATPRRQAPAEVRLGRPALLHRPWCCAWTRWATWRSTRCCADLRAATRARWPLITGVEQLAPDRASEPPAHAARIATWGPPAGASGRAARRPWWTSCRPTGARRSWTPGRRAGRGARCRLAAILTAVGRGAIAHAVLLVVDEAHNVCPARAPTRSGHRHRHTVRIAAEGRKYGLYLLLATQSPGKLHPDVLSQCENLLLMRTNSTGDWSTSSGSSRSWPPG